MKSLKCNELISLLKSHSDLGEWNAPHFCNSEKKKHLFLGAPPPRPAHVVAIFATFHSLQGILSIPTHAFVTFVQINNSYDFRYDYPPWHLVKMTSSHINDNKVVCNCICNSYLQLMLIWMKMKMKNMLISSIFNGIPK